MTWYAKPKGSYGMYSTEGNANIFEMASCWPAWTDAAKSAAIGNSIHEGGLNPWRWQNDSQSSVDSGGYGLFQFTPGSAYTSLSFAAPNMSVSEVTAGADPSDGATQCDMVASNYLGKWVSSCWRSYWDTTTYATLYAYRSQVLNTWGSGNSISIAQFGQITDVDAATFVFLACFEGPAVPNYGVRATSANKIYEILTGTTPPTPDPPDPPTPPTPTGTVPPWLLFKIRKNLT